MILTLYPRGKDSVSLRWLQLAAHNHLPHSIIRPCGARMQRQQWKENPMEDLCWTVATSAQKQKTIRWKCLKSNLQKVSQLKSIEIPMAISMELDVETSEGLSGLSWKKTQTVFFRHFCAADLDLKGWSANAASPARFLSKFLWSWDLQEKGLDDEEKGVLWNERYANGLRRLSS